MNKHEVFYSVDELVERPTPNKSMSSAEKHHIVLWMKNQPPTNNDIARADWEGMAPAAKTK